MHTIILEGTLTALTSISHIGESHGTAARLRREKVLLADGTIEDVPVISGNSLRGILRDRGMLHMLGRLGYGVEAETGQVHGLSLAAFYFLFSGGSLTKDASRGLDVDRARAWRDAIPLVALFGGAMGNQIMPGKLKVGKLIPICAETAHLVPERFVADAKPLSVWDLVQEEAYTRRDDEKNEPLRQLIAPDVRGLLEAHAAEKRARAGTLAEEPAGETGAKQQMRYYVETLCAGTQFYWDLALDDVTEVELDAFAVTLSEFSRLPYVGGKSAVGHGKVAVHFDSWLRIDPRAQPAGQALDVPLGARYLEHLRTRADDIRTLINGLA